jgi:hypothetical protein
MGVARSVAHFRVQQPPSAFVAHLSYEHFAKAAHAASALHLSHSVLHSFAYAPVVSLVQSLHTVYAPLPLDELDDVIPDEPDDDDDVIPDEPDDDVDVSPELLDELAPLDELDVLLVVPVPVSSLHAPSAKSAHEATKIADTPR